VDTLITACRGGKQHSCAIRQRILDSTPIENRTPFLRNKKERVNPQVPEPPGNVLPQKSECKTFLNFFNYFIQRLQRAGTSSPSILFRFCAKPERSRLKSFLTSNCIPVFGIDSSPSSGVPTDCVSVRLTDYGRFFFTSYAAGDLVPNARYCRPAVPAGQVHRNSVRCRIPLPAFRNAGAPWRRRSRCA
jgi:hypothetical protein